jgi:PKD repeat protein
MAPKGKNTLFCAMLLTAGLMLPLLCLEAQAARNNNLRTMETTDLTPDYVGRANTYVPMMSFTLRDSADEQFTKAVVNYTGTNLSDISSLMLFRELGGSGGSFNATQDIFLAVANSPAIRLINLSFSFNLPRNNNFRFYIVANVSTNAQDTDSIDVRINVDDLTVQGRTWPDAPYDTAGVSKVDAAPPSGWADFRPVGWQPTQSPDCSISVSDNASGLAVKTAGYRFSTDNGTNWTNWTNTSCTGVNGTNASQNITALKVPFGRDSGTDNLICFRIKDVLGNLGTSPNYTVKADTASPELWTLLSPSGWYTRDQKPDVSASVQDRLSGISNVTMSAELSTNGGFSWSSATKPNCTGPAGQYMANITAWAVPFNNDSGWGNYVRFNASDLAGNSNVSPPYLIKIDTTPPAVPSIGSEPQYTNGSYNNISWNATPDPISGRSKYRALCDDDPDFSAPATVEASNATSCVFSNLTDGVKYYYKVAQLNNAGLLSGYSPVVNSTQDSSAPFTRVSTSPSAPNGDNGWFVNETILRFNSSDNTSGVAVTKYSINSGETVNGTQIVLSSDGEFLVRYWSEDNAGNTEQIQSILVRIDRTPPVAVMQSLATLYQNESASFDGSASAGADSYIWDFGDGSAQATGTAVSHTYSQMGVFMVSLTVKDRAGLTCTTRSNVKVVAKGVNYPPVAYIGPFPIIYAQVQVSFDGAQSGDEEPTTLRYDWDFGDGSSGTDAQAAHSYQAAGTFTVKLKVTDSAGLFDTASREIRVYVQGENHPPLAHISQENVAYVGEPVLLDASNSSDEDLSNATFSWDLGDGTTAMGMMVSHTYAVESIYLVRLNLTDKQGLIGRTELAVRIFIRGENLPPNAQFTFFPIDPRNGQSVEFDASLSMDEDPFTLNFTWDFGDGTGAQGKIAGHAYTKKGEYVVKLRVRDRGGLFDTYTYQVSVAEGKKPVQPVTDQSWLIWAGGALIAACLVIPLAYLAVSRRKKTPVWEPARPPQTQPSHGVEGPVSLISPIPPNQAPPMIVVETGLNYLMDADQPAVAYNSLAKLTSGGARGLMFTTVHPKKVLKATQLQNTELIWLSEITGEEPSIDPAKMEYEIAEKTMSFIKDHRWKGVVLIDGIELLIQYHGFEKVLQFIHNVNEVASVNESTVIANVHSKAMKDVEFNQLKRRFDRW